MAISTRARLLFLIGFVLVALSTPSPAQAQTTLVDAFPPANQSTDFPPEEVRLTFATPLERISYSLTVLDAVGTRVDRGNAHVLPNDSTVLVVSVPFLDEGLYTVTYTVTDSESLTTTGGSYQFALAYPTPQIALVNPPDGAGFETSTVMVRIDTGNFDLDSWGYAWQLYLDGSPVVTTQRPWHILRDLEQGVHELVVVLVDANGNEVHDTRRTSHIAIGRPDPEAEEIARAATGPGDPGLVFSRGGAIALVVVIVICIGAGILLGRRASPEAS